MDSISAGLHAHESRCRDCGGPLDTVLDLGVLCLSRFPDQASWAHPATQATLPRAPLDLCACRTCRLVQLRHTVEPDLLFREYWYQSGINETMRAELTDVATAATQRVDRLYALDVILDIGANDGTLLQVFDGTEALRVAFEPAHNLFKALRPHADVVVADYFPLGLDQHKGLFGRVKILTAIACFYATDRPHAFLTAVRSLLHPKGVCVLQFQDLAQMLGATAFDNICHEHLFYPSLTDLVRMTSVHGLVIAHAERRTINGGSLRLFIRHQGQGPADETVPALLEAEREAQDWQRLQRFAWQVDQARQQIVGAIEYTVRSGQSVDLYGASTKGNTLLQVCGLGDGWIRQAWERSPEKVGRRTVTGIPIVSEEEGRKDPPALLVPTIWQFRDHLLRREAAYLEAGGRILLPLPVCELVEGAKV